MGFLKRMDKCREQRDKHEARKARFKKLVLARIRLLQRNVERAEECRRLLIQNTKDRQMAEEDVRVLRAKAGQVLQQCASIERLAGHLKPFKAFVEAAAGLCVMESAEGLVKRVTTLQNTNDELRRQLTESSDRLEQKRAEHNARHAQNSMRRLALASKVSFLRSQVEALRQTRQELEQGIDAKAQLLAKDAAAVGAVCTHVQMLHARLHQSRFARQAAAAAAIAAAEKTFFASSAPGQQSKLCLDVMRAMRLLQQIGDLACKYKSMIKAAEEQLLPRMRTALGHKFAPASPGQPALLLSKGSPGTPPCKKTGEHDGAVTCNAFTAGSTTRLRPQLNSQPCNGTTNNDSISTGRQPPPVHRASVTNAGQDYSENPVGSSPRSYTAKRNAVPNHVTLLYEERGRRIAASPGEEDEDVVQFLLLEGEKKSSPFHRGSMSRFPPSSVSAALLLGNSTRAVHGKEGFSSVSGRLVPIASLASSRSQTPTKSLPASPLLHETRVSSDGSKGGVSASLLSEESNCRENSVQRLVSADFVSSVSSGASNDVVSRNPAVVSRVPRMQSMTAPLATRDSTEKADL